MTEQELKDRIDSLYGQQIVSMSDESLRKLTSNFKESLVRRVVAIGSSPGDQEMIIERIEDTLNTFYRTNYRNRPV